MLCLDASAAGHSRISSSHHVHFEWAVFDLDLRPGYLCNHGAATRNDILFFSTQPRVSNWGHFFLQFGLVRGYELPRRTWRPLSRNILVNNISSLFPSASLTSDTHTHTHSKRKKKSLSLMRRLQRGDKKGAFIYVLLLKGLEGIWRVCFFPPLSLSLARSLFFEIGFTRRRAVSLHLWMKSMWLASRTAGSFSTAPADICSWFVQQNPGAGRGGLVEMGWERVAGKRKRGGFFFFFFFFFSGGTAPDFFFLKNEGGGGGV